MCSTVFYKYIFSTIIYKFFDFQTLQSLIETVLEKKSKSLTPTSSAKPSP